MRVGIIADQHHPFCHPKYLGFCLGTFDRYQVEFIINIGDVLDQYFASRYPKNPEKLNPAKELDRARQQVALWAKEMPQMLVCTGNHDVRIFKRMHDAGIPVKGLVPDLDKLLEVPGWVWAPHHVVENVMYTHGTGWSGVTASRRMAAEAGRSVVHGHLHKFASVSWLRLHNKKRSIFGMNVGAGIDVRSHAFSYGRDPLGTTLGCGIVLDGEEAIFVPMRA